MNAMSVIIWIGIIVFVIFLIVSFRKRSLHQKEEAEYKRKRDLRYQIHDLLEKFEKINKRYLMIKGVLRLDSKTIIRMDNLVQRVRFRFEFSNNIIELSYAISSFEDEMKPIEELYTRYQYNLLDKESAITECKVLFSLLKKDLESCKSINLSEEQRHLVVSINNRLVVDMQKIDKHPMEALRRTKSSIKKLDALIASSNGGGFFCLKKQLLGNHFKAVVGVLP